MAGTSSPHTSGHAGPPCTPVLRHPVDGSLPEPWGSEGVFLRPRQEQEATTVLHVMDRDMDVVDVNTELPTMYAVAEPPPGSELFQQTLQELRAKSPPAPTTSSDETMPSGPDRPTIVRRRKSLASRRLSRPNVQGSTTPTSSSSNNTSCPAAPVPVRSQHALSHVRANRLSAKNNPHGKADVAIHRKQLRSAEMARMRRFHNRPVQDTEIMTAAVRSETHLLDGEPGWSREEIPETESSSTGFFITPSSYSSLWDEEPRIAPPISWKTLTEARQKCTEWLVQHVLLPDPTPTRSRPRTRSTTQL